MELYLSNCLIGGRIVPVYRPLCIIKKIFTIGWLFLVLLIVEKFAFEFLLYTEIYGANKSIIKEPCYGSVQIISGSEFIRSNMENFVI